MAPATGGPTNEPIDVNAINTPILNPISCIGEMVAIKLGPNPMTPPELNPKKAAKQMMAALLWPGSQRASTRIAESRDIKVIALKRPYLSAK
jgi:hypothetical protein